jgi:integrase
MPTPILDKTDTGHFYAYWSEGKRSRRKSMGTQDRDTAEQRFAEWLLIGGHRNNPTTEQRAALTVSQLWQVYRTKHVEKENVSPVSADKIWNNLGPHFGHLTLGLLNQDCVDDYEKKRAAGKIGLKSGSSTVRREIGALVAALNYCARPRHNPRIIEKADIPLIDLPAEGEPRDRWLRMEEMQRLLDAAAKMRRGPRLSRIERFLWLALETAARKQAILDLTWDRVDFDTNTIDYNVPGRKLTKKRRVTVAISPALRPILLRAYEERVNEIVLDSDSDVWTSVQRAAINAGFGGERRGSGQKPTASGVSPHVLRHTAATHMARNGVPLFVISKVLGNTIAMVEKVYAKWCPDDPAGTVGRISNGVLEPAE